MVQVGVVRDTAMEETTLENKTSNHLNMSHIYPMGDYYHHSIYGASCRCLPIIDIKHQTIIHNSWDAREFFDDMNNHPFVFPCISRRSH